MGQSSSLLDQFRIATGGNKSLLTAAAVAAAVLVAGTGWMMFGSSAQDTATIAIATHRPLATKTASPATSHPSKTLRTTGRNPFQGTGSTAVSASASASSSAATATGTRTAVYLVLMSFTSPTTPTGPEKAVFWVNDARFTVAVGAKFDSGAFTFVAKTSSTCAKVKYSGAEHTLCIGEVTLVA